jgi:hypothetical protein
MSAPRALKPQDSFDAFHDFCVVQQCASAGVGPAFLDGFEEFGILFQNVIDGFLNKRRSILTCASGKVAKSGFLIR